jgi:hypothetical protein
MSSKTPDTEALATVLRACVEDYARANRGSEMHLLGAAEVGSIEDFLPQLKSVPSIKGGFALRFKDGTTFLVNVHEIPGSKPA